MDSLLALLVLSTDPLRAGPLGQEGRMLPLKVSCLGDVLSN